MKTMDTDQELLWQQEMRRRDMLLHADVARLSELLSPDLCYVHTNGEVDRKNDVLRKLSDGRLRYLGMRDESKSAHVFPHAGLVHTLTWLEVEVQGVKKHMLCSTTGLWFKEDNIWRLVFYRSCREEMK